MNSKHKKAFQELRQWCEKWDAEIYCTDIRVGYVEYTTTSEILRDYDPFMQTTSKIIDETKKIFNFMEQEDDNTEK